MRTEGLKSVLPSALVATLIVTSMAFVISTTPVNAPSTISASPGATLSPTSAMANTEIEFTVTVTNDYAADNIDNVLLIGPGFTQPTDLELTTWVLSEVTYGVRFDAIGDNVIAPGGSETFVFLWTTPNIPADYMISVLVSKEETIYTAYENLGGLIVTIEGLIPHAPIYIEGNDNFIPANGVTSGSGTPGDLYIIENWDISAENAHVIEIRNTTAYFIIRNCYVHDGWVEWKQGIRFENVMNGRIENNLVENNGYGIWLSYSDNNLVTNNRVENNRYDGIILGSSDNNLVTNNRVENNRHDGIRLLSYSYNNLVENNLVENNGTGINLYNSDNNLIENNLVENNSYGIILGSSDNNLSDNNTCENNDYYGIYLYDSDNNTLSNNLVRNNDYRGIYIDSSDNNTLTNNTCENNGSYGIYLDYSSHNTLSNNTCENNDYGIAIAFSDNNTLDNNTCENNDYAGIQLGSSGNNTLTNNTCENNQYNFRVYGTTLSYFIHNIDTSNLVNGKPIRYLVDNSNEVIGPSLEMGYLGLVNCDNLRVENLALGHNEQGILLASTQNSRVENCIFENNRYGIYLYDSDNNILNNNTCENNGSYGIYLRDYSDNNLIDNNTCENNDYGGIGLYDSDNNTLTNNTCENNDWYGIRLEGSSNNTLTNNTCENTYLQYGGDGIHFSYSSNNILTNSTLKGNERGIQFSNSNNNNVENCVIANNKWRGIALDESANNTITNCVVENSFRGIELYWSDNNTITDCVVENNYNQCGILIANASDNNVIENNNSSNNTRGIYIADSLEITIKNNVFENDGISIWGENVYHFNTHVIENNTVNGKPVYYYADISGIEVPDDAGGVILANCSNMIVRNLEISNSTVGIELTYTQDSQITNNLLSHNLGAIYLVYSENNIIANNEVFKNSDGIELWWNSDNNIVKNNVLSNNVYGIELWENSDNNCIYHNDIENNENQAYDDSSNYWDDGYPSGGNYWSDYIGPDANGDGIGDTPYYIPGDSCLDRYPFMNPFPQWTGTAVFRLKNLWAVRLEKNLDLNQGSKLVVKFYTWGSTPQDESVIETFSPPWHVEENEIVPHPQGEFVEKARLVLTTDNTEEVISTLASFTVQKVDLEVRFTEIPLEWALAPTPAEKVELEIEFSGIPLYWALAPS